MTEQISYRHPVFDLRDPFWCARASDAAGNQRGHAQTWQLLHSCGGQAYAPVDGIKAPHECGVAQLQQVACAGHAIAFIDEICHMDLVDIDVKGKTVQTLSPRHGYEAWKIFNRRFEASCIDFDEPVLRDGAIVLERRFASSVWFCKELPARRVANEPNSDRQRVLDTNEKAQRVAARAFAQLVDHKVAGFGMTMAPMVLDHPGDNTRSLLVFGVFAHKDVLSAMSKDAPKDYFVALHDLFNRTIGFEGFVQEGEMASRDDWPGIDIVG